MSKFFRYLSYICRHKWYVMIECFKHGIIWRGLMHDLTKFMPFEFLHYMNWFSDDEFNALKSAANSLGRHNASIENLALLDLRQCKFDEAWLYHQKRNPHHWQYWILMEDSSKVKVIEMPKQYALEMFCDWVGAGIAITGKRDVVGWYAKNHDKMMLYSGTRAYIEQLIEKEKQRVAA